MGWDEIYNYVARYGGKFGDRRGTKLLTWIVTADGAISIIISIGVGKQNTAS